MIVPVTSVEFTGYRIILTSADGKYYELMVEDGANITTPSLIIKEIKQKETENGFPLL